MDETVSIIVPVYNTSQYLQKCLDSILNQTYKNMQIICVNDGSSDESSIILSNYLQEDCRIIVTESCNEGVSKARNKGLRLVAGDYVMFVDADDWIDPDTCALAVKRIQETQADAALWSYVSEYCGNQSYKKIFSGDKVFCEEDCRNLLHRRFVGIMGNELAHPELADAICPVWGKLYKRNIIQKSRAKFVDLREIGTYEDGLFNLEVFREVNKAVYIDDCLYHYRRDNVQSTTSKYNPYLFERWQHLYLRMESYIKENKLPIVYMHALQNRRALGILGLSLNIVSADFSVYRKVLFIQRILNDKRYIAAYSTLDFHYFPIHWKVFYGCAKWRLALGVYMLGGVIQWIITH